MVCGQNIFYHVVAFNDHILKKFCLTYPTSRVGGGSAGKIFATMLLHICYLAAAFLGCVSLAPNGVRRCLACASGLCRSRDRGWVVSRAIEQKRRNSTYFVVRTVKRRNRPRRFHALVEIRRDRRTPVVRLSAETPRDPNQSSAPPVMDY